jgi:hypothetical protein
MFCQTPDIHLIKNGKTSTFLRIARFVGLTIREGLNYKIIYLIHKSRPSPGYTVHFKGKDVRAY